MVISCVKNLPARVEPLEPQCQHDTSKEPGDRVRPDKAVETTHENEGSQSRRVDLGVKVSVDRVLHGPYRTDGPRPETGH